MSIGGLRGLSNTINTDTTTASEIAGVIESNPWYRFSDLSLNLQQINSIIDTELDRLGIRGYQAAEIKEEVLTNLRHESGISYDTSWMSSTANIEL